MSRPPTIPAEKKLRIVLSVLQGEISIAEAARREHVDREVLPPDRHARTHLGALAGLAGDSYRTRARRELLKTPPATSAAGH